MSYLSLCRFVMIPLIVMSIHPAMRAQNKKSEYYEIKQYNYTTPEQEAILDNYLKTAYLPALHKAGIKQVGVFKAIANDTSANKRLFVFFSSSALDKLTALPDQLQKDGQYTSAAAAYLTAPYDHPPFARIETILLKAFPLAPVMNLPSFTNDKTERVYELRSYESPTENLFRSKVKMFNEGGEIPLFRRLSFNAVFYASVVSGSHMPNLMYMTSFENMEQRQKHWDAFKDDPEWKRLSGLPEYQHNVSKADIMLLHGVAYSDF